jgi:hypothetical protein
MNRLPFILLALCIWNSSCNSQSTPATEKITLPVTHKYELTQTYSDSINKFSMSFPKGWQLSSNYQGNVLMGVGPLISAENKIMKRDGGFGVRLRDLGKEYPSQVWFEGNIKPLKKDYQDFKTIEQADIDLNGISGIYVCHSVTERGTPITTIQIYFTRGTIGYILNGTSTTESFKEYRDLYLEIARTFKFD